VGWLIDAGWDFFAIQKRVGHASIKTTFETSTATVSRTGTATDSTPSTPCSRGVSD
jgi:hypothetical protein